MICSVGARDLPIATWNAAALRYYVPATVPGRVGIVALADGVAPNKLLKFTRSALEHVPYASLVLLSNSLSCTRALTIRFQQFKLHYRDFNKLLGRLWLTEGVARASVWKRFIACDATELYFQRDPFPLMPNLGVYYALEEPWKTLGYDAYNTGWMECFGGAKVWNRVNRTARMANGGFIGFTDHTTSLRNILNQGAVEMMHFNGPVPSCFNDQGLLNLAIWTKLVRAHEFTSILNDRHEIRAKTSMGLWREKSSHVSMVDGLPIVDPSDVDVPAAVVHHWNRKLIRGAAEEYGRRIWEMPPIPAWANHVVAEMIGWSQKRVYEFKDATNLRIVHTDRYTPLAFDKPKSPQNITAFCPHLVRPSKPHDNRDWRFCDAPSQVSVMEMHVIEQADAMFDRGQHNMGATFDRHHVYLMSHPFSMPAMHLTNVRRYSKLAQALEPYAAEAQSHFWFGTIQHVLTLYDVLPDDVPIVVAWSPALATCFDMLNLNMSRLIPFQPSVTYVADRLYSIVPQPWSRTIQGGEPVSPQSFARLRAHLKVPEPPSGRLNVVLIDRADRGARRCLNHKVLDKEVQRFAKDKGMGYNYFVGSQATLVEAQHIFKDAEVVVATHGGALLNMVFMTPGMTVVEIGYYETNATNYRSMRFPPWYFVMAKRLELNYHLIMAPGAYNGHIDCPVNTVLGVLHNATAS
jgi:hypothetical protein